MAARGSPAGPWHRAGFWQRARRLPSRTSLRVKLIAAVLSLVAIALVVISIAGITVLRNNLIQQQDSQIRTLFLQAQSGRHFGVAATGPDRWVYEALIANSPPQEVGRSGNLRPGSPLPDVAANEAWLAAHPGEEITIPAQSGDARWRVAAFPDFTFHTTANSPIIGTLVVGLDASNDYATIGKLVSIDLIVSMLVLLGLAVLGVALIRASLRPLTDIERTAEAIASGDLSRRVPDRDPRTEVGRLGRSLNSMLAQVENAFRARAESESAARRSEKRMRQFVADASHELRTPLTAIRGFAEYYRQRGGIETAANGNTAPEPGLGRADLDRIMRRVEQESARMGVLVEDMLLLARLDQQRPLDRSPVDLLTLAADAVHDARVVAPERSINLTVGPGAAPLVLGDEVRLRQVIGNLMSNALMHTPAGSPIEVRIRSGTLEEGQAARQVPPSRQARPGPRTRRWSWKSPTAGPA